MKLKYKGKINYNPKNVNKNSICPNIHFSKLIEEIENFIYSDTGTAVEKELANKKHDKLISMMNIAGTDRGCVSDCRTYYSYKGCWKYFGHVGRVNDKFEAFMEKNKKNGMDRGYQVRDLRTTSEPECIFPQEWVMKKEGLIPTGEILSITQSAVTFNGMVQKLSECHIHHLYLYAKELLRK